MSKACVFNETEPEAAVHWKNKTSLHKDELLHISGDNQLNKIDMDFFDVCITWFCLLLAFKLSPQTLVQRHMFDSHTCMGSHMYNCLYLHTQTCSEIFILGRKRKPSVFVLIKQFIYHYVWLCICVLDHLESSLTVISYFQSHLSMSAVDGFDCWAMWHSEGAWMEIPLLLSFSCLI